MYAYFLANEAEMLQLRSYLDTIKRGYKVFVLDDIGDPNVAYQNGYISAATLVPDITCYEILLGERDRVKFENTYVYYLTQSVMSCYAEEVIALMLTVMIIRQEDIIIYLPNGYTTSVYDPKSFTNVLFDILRLKYGINPILPQQTQAYQTSLIGTKYYDQIMTMYKHGCITDEQFVEMTTPNRLNEDGSAKLFIPTIRLE